VHDEITLDSASDTEPWRPPESPGMVTIAAIAFAITLALMSLLAFTGVIRL